jgi:beta-N-acetylhexosaminidase
MTTHSHGPLIGDLDGLELQASDREFLLHPKLGGIILFARNFESVEQLRALVADVRQLRQDLFICVDQEGGRVQRFKEGFSRLPPMRRIGERFESHRELGHTDAFLIGSLMAYELVSLGIDLSFAPVLDLYDSQSRVIGDRSFSASPADLIELAESFVAGMRRMGMHACIKHFPGHGGVIEDSHMELPVDRRSYEEISSRDMQPFSVLSTKAAAVMTAHIQFPQVCQQPVSFSEYWIKDILRKKVGFNGLIFSDDLSMKGAAGIDSFADRAKCALAAGCDAVLVCNNRTEAETCLEALERENISGERSLASLRHRFTGVNKDLVEQLERAKLCLEKYFD